MINTYKKGLGHQRFPLFKRNSNPFIDWEYWVPEWDISNKDFKMRINILRRQYDNKMIQESYNLVHCSEVALVSYCTDCGYCVGDW